jgi:type IV pilus assembly protein PilA
VDDDRNQSGFTLIELMVVVLILAILIAIAIPTFLGAQDRARDRGAQSDLRNAVTAAKTVATDHGGLFLDDTGSEIAAGDMPDVEPAIFFDDIATTPEAMYLHTEPGGLYITFVQQSSTDTFYGITVDRDGVVQYCRSSVSQDDCDDGVLDAANYADSW